MTGCRAARGGCAPCAACPPGGAFRLMRFRRRASLDFLQANLLLFAASRKTPNGPTACWSSSTKLPAGASRGSASTVREVTAARALLLGIGHCIDDRAFVGNNG